MQIFVINLLFKMKKYIALSILILVLFITRTQAQTEYYGKKINSENAISVEQLAERLKLSDSLQTKVKGNIIASCAKKGCWMDVQLPENKIMKVTFKDYAFFVPKGMTKGNAIMEGVARKEIISVAMLRHYAQDAGKSKEEIEKINSPQTVITFEATGVIIQ